MEEEGELEGVERSGLAGRCPRPPVTLFHLRGSWSKHVTAAPCPKPRPGSKRKQRASKGRRRSTALRKFKI